MKKDYSDDIECYNSCPHCGKKNLGFQTSLDVINYMKTGEHKYISTIYCLSCFYSLAVKEVDIDTKKTSIYEENRRRWNQLSSKGKIR